MKPVLKWLKANWVVVVCGVVALGAPIAGLIISSGMNAKIRQDVQTSAAAAFRDVQSPQATYWLPAVVPGGKQFEQSVPFNEEVTAAYRDRWEDLKKQIKSAADRVVEFNRKGRTPLMDRVFPVPQGDRTYLLTEFQERFAGRALDDLLANSGAGTPPDADKLAAQLKALYDQRIQKILADQGVTQLTAEDDQKLLEDMTQRRLGSYRQRAGEISFYGDRSVLLGLPERGRPSSPPSVGQAWDWQEQYWVLEDLLHAISDANGHEWGKKAGEVANGVESSVVKRLESFSVNPPQYLNQQQNWRGEGDQGVQETPLGDTVPSTTQVLTGRMSGPNTGNGLYDIRRVNITVVVSAQRLPQFFDALAKTNYISVLNCDLHDVQPLKDLAEGYWYGPEKVYRADLWIETIWLRPWTANFTPPEVRKLMGIPEPQPETPESPEGEAGSDGESAGDGNGGG